MFPRCKICLALLALLLLVGSVAALPPAHPSDVQGQQQALAPTYRIFATRMGLVGGQTANGHVVRPRDRFVALPSWQALSSRQGFEFQVRLTYNGRSVVVPVWDVGPWNTNDAYWQAERGDYTDLPVGLPQAEAAYYDGHNGGRDEFGRSITNPNGIDIADGTFWDDLGMTNNDWVEVSFLWLGSDPGPGAAVQVPGPVPPPADDDQTTDPPPPPDTSAPPAQQAPPPPTPTPAPTAIPLDDPEIPGGAIVLDNSDADFLASDAPWQTFVCGVNGDHLWAASGTDADNELHRAIWTLPGEPGGYEVLVYIPPCGDVPATRAATYAIQHDSGIERVQVDQAAAEGTWVSLGSYGMGRRSDPKIRLGSTAGDSGQAVRFDAVAWLPVVDTIAPTAWMTRIRRERNGYRLEWDGSDDLSGVLNYDVQVRQLPRGSWRLWLDQQELTSAWFGPDEGKHFAFRVRARDWEGNEQVWESAGVVDTTTAEEPPGE